MQKGPPSLKLRQVQEALEQVYRLNQFEGIDHFLISGEELCSYLPSLKVPRPQVLFHQDDSEVHLSVHIGDEVVERLERQGIEGVSLPDLCSVVEEVSHFLFLVWSLHNQRPVSLLDLEMQGEIDKFILASLCFPESENLFDELFENYQLGEDLGEGERDLYHQANRLGGKFCRSLEIFRREGETGKEDLARLRSFWRLATQQRLAHVEKL